MQELPNLSELSHSEKDDLIRYLRSMLESQPKQIAALQSQVAELQSKLNKNSRNSSKPASSDGLNKPAPKSLPVAGKNPTGGQKGHAGSTALTVRSVNGLSSVSAIQSSAPPGGMLFASLRRWFTTIHQRHRDRYQCNAVSNAVVNAHHHGAAFHALSPGVVLNQMHLPERALGATSTVSLTCWAVSEFLA